MADQDAQDRNLPASARKLRKAREQGQVARSRDLGHFAALAAGGAVIVVLAPSVAGAMQQRLAAALRLDAQAVQRPQAMVERLAGLAFDALLLILPFGLLMMLVALAAGVLAGGWNWTMQPLSPKFSKLNPLSGLGRVFSKHQLLETLKACLLALVLGGLGAHYLQAHVGEFAQALGLALPAAIGHSTGKLYGGLSMLVGALAVFALLDVPLQRKWHLDRLKMSREEVKQEHKELEGNQEVKGRMRARMREMSRKRMLAAVPQADLVVMNPSHYAVALKYDEATMAAPRVVAKGTDLLAMKIRDLARDARVPVLQSPPLARALYAHAEVDGEIPVALFAAVAQVLAYVYQLRAAMTGRGPMPAGVPEVPVPPELDPHTQRPPAEGGRA